MEVNTCLEGAKVHTLLGPLLLLLLHTPAPTGSALVRLLSNGSPTWALFIAPKAVP